METGIINEFLLGLNSKIDYSRWEVRQLEKKINSIEDVDIKKSAEEELSFWKHTAEVYIKKYKLFHHI